MTRNLDCHVPTLTMACDLRHFATNVLEDIEIS